MRSFMGNDFLLDSPTAERLFNACKDLPIIDYHCHLSPKEIFEDKKYDNIARLWLGGDNYGDHYKWRLMRACGVEEKYITGDASDYDKFVAFATILPRCIGNPVYHWAHLELRRYFDCDLPINAANADAIWKLTSEKIANGISTVRGFIEASNVETVCTTDDPIDSLEWHAAIRNEGKFSVKVLPTFRPDKAYNISKPDFPEYVCKLSAVVGYKIDSAEKLVKALLERVDFFHANGCVITDHAFMGFPYSPCTDATANEIFARAMAGTPACDKCFDQFATYVLTALAKKYNSLGMAMQLHIGAIRDNNTAGYERLGADVGFDSVCDNLLARNLSGFFGSLGDEVPKTIFYTLNPSDFYVLATMAGNFQKAGVRSHMQLGTSWWFIDHIDGMLQQMHTLADLGVLGNFIGMLTDSRSFLSYPRHEYFRRIMCNLIAGWVEHGEYAPDFDTLEALVRDISYYNVKAYLGLN